MSQDWNVEIDPRLLSVAPLLLHAGRGGEQPDTRFFERLLAWSAERHGWNEALREYLDENDFEAAIACYLESPARDGSLLRAVRDCWVKWRRQQEADLQSLRAEQAMLHSLADAPVATEAREFLDRAAELLAMIAEDAFESDATAGSAREALRSLKPAEISDSLALAKFALEEERSRIADRMRLVLNRLRDIKTKVDQIASDLLLRSDVPPAHQRALDQCQLLLNDALRTKSVLLAEQCMAVAQRLSEGRPEASDLVAATRAARPSEGLGLQSSFGPEQLSPTAQQLLVPQRDLKPPETGVAEGFSAFDPWKWDASELQRWKVAQLVAADGGSGAEPDRKKRVAEVLFAEAKIRLLRGDAYIARILFADTFRWSCQFTGEQGRAQRMGAAAGILVSTARLFLRPGEAPLLDANTLATEFQRHIDAYLVARLDRHGLLTALTSTLVQLGCEAGSMFLQTCLLPYLQAHARAAYDVLAALIDSANDLPGVALFLVCQATRLLLPGILPERLGDIAEGARRLPPGDRGAAREVVNALRSALLPIAEDHDVAGAVESFLGQLARQLEEPLEAPRPLGLSLVTPEVPAMPEARVVVRVTWTGGGTLRNVRSQLLLQDKAGARVLDETPLIASIAADSAREIDFVVAADQVDALVRTGAVGLRHLRLDSDGVARSLPATTEHFSIKFTPPREIRPVNNPYVVGIAVTDLRRIFGREEDIDRIWRALVGEKQDNVVLVRGARKIGKTTLLNAVEKHPKFTERYVIGREDLQVKDETEVRVVFQMKLYTAVVKALKNAQLQAPYFPDARFKKAPGEAFKDFMIEVDRILARAGRRLLLILDELDQLAENAVFGALAVAALRETVLATRHTSFILAGAREILDRLTLTRDDRLFKLGPEVTLSLLPEDAARNLAQLPARESYSMSSLAVDRVVRETNRQPYLIQAVCHELFQRMTASGVKHVAERDVENTMTRDIVPRNTFFHDYKSAVPDEEDYRILKAIALRQWGNQYVSLADLARDLGQGSPGHQRILNSRLQRLMEQAPEVVDRKLHSSQYRLKVGLFARHLRYLQEGTFRE